MSSSRILALRTKLVTVTTIVSEKVVLPEKFKGTFVERWSKYWRSLINDYGDVAKDSFKSVKDSPLRAAVAGGVAYFIYLSCIKNPDELSLIEAVRKQSAEMVTVPETCQRKESAEYLKMLERSINHGTLRTFNLGVATIAWQHDYNSELCTYRATCKYLQPEIATFPSRIIDVGFWNKWWNLDKKMIDYDIAEEES